MEKRNLGQESKMTPVILREWLTKMDLTTTKAAALFKVSQRTVQRWLAGTHPIPPWVPVIISLVSQKQP